jgi:hypothetical protein
MVKYTIFNYAPEMYEKDKKLVDDINSKVPYFGKCRVEDAPEVAKIFKEYGYKGLRVASNQSSNAFMPLDQLVNLHPSRIITVARDMYFQANKRIGKFGNPLENPGSPFYKKKSLLEDKIEGDGQITLFR